MSEQQQFISEIWLEKAKHIYHSEDKYNLTALRAGKAKHDAEVTFLKQTQLITNNTALLDLACGNGRLCEAFAPSVKWVTGTDLCEDFIVFLNQWKTDHSINNADFFKLDLLEATYSSFFDRHYSVILLFGVSQIIIDDNQLLRIFKNIKSLLSHDGHLFIKQTTSLSNENVKIDHYSETLKQRWVAHYRSRNRISELCQQAGLKVCSSQEIYNTENLGEDYSKVECWDNTRQMVFDVTHDKLKERCDEQS